jgi:hypothetical protein
MHCCHCCRKHSYTLAPTACKLYELLAETVRAIHTAVQPCTNNPYTLAAHYCHTTIQHCQQRRGRYRRSRSRDRYTERPRNASRDETAETEPVAPAADPKKTAAAASAAEAVAAGKKLTPAELLKLRMRHMMAATIQKDRYFQP